jgi:plasmid stability protein
MQEDRKMMVRVPEDLHREVRIKSAELGRPTSEIVRQFLRAWVSGELPTPPLEKDNDE